MSQAGHPPPLLVQFSAPPSATSSTGDLSVDPRFLSSLIDRTRNRIQLNLSQVPSLSLRECDALSSAEALILLFLHSTIHAISALGDRLQELYSTVHLLQSQLANSPAGADLRDLSHRLPPLTIQRQSGAPPPPLPATRLAQNPSGSAPSAGPHQVTLGPSILRPNPIPQAHADPSAPNPPPMLTSSMAALVSLTQPLLKTPQGVRQKEGASPILASQPPKSWLSSRPPPEGASPTIMHCQKVLRSPSLSCLPSRRSPYPYPSTRYCSLLPERGQLPTPRCFQILHKQQRISYSFHC